jgi:hypothetical protein
VTEEVASVRCGDDLRGRVPGEYLCIADPVCQGPVHDGALPAYVSTRAGFVAAHYAHDVGAVRARIGAEYAALRGLAAGAPLRRSRVLLWFEGDLWDQACLLRVLSFLADTPALAGRLFLMPSDGVRPFAHLPPAELDALVPEPLPWSAVEAAAAAWRDFAAEDPTGLDALSRRALPLPHLARALRRHLQDLPWTTDGLALTERAVLRAVAEGAEDEAAVLRAVGMADPAFHLTDLIVRDVLGRLRGGTRRLISRDPPHRPTPLGAAVLSGAERHRPTVRFVGGVPVRPGSGWRWDPRRAVGDGGPRGLAGPLALGVADLGVADLGVADLGVADLGGGRAGRGFMPRDGPAPRRCRAPGARLASVHWREPYRASMRVAPCDRAGQSPERCGVGAPLGAGRR